jgi:putative glutamine amidotransferase
VASNDSDTYRPKLGLTTYFQLASWGDWSAPAALVPGTYVEAVVAAGATPVLLPPLGTDTAVLDLLDGLIVIGGADVDPSAYGADPHPLTKPQPLRDSHDLVLTRAALQRELPLFAICRGAQILNVALGGTLLQHIPDVLPEANYRPAPGVFGQVEFTTENGSLASEILGPHATAPCYHHQAIAEVPDPLIVTARSKDGIVQAVETRGNAWVLGVQFHPEQNPSDGRLFAGFVEAARQHHQTREGALTA